MNDLEHDLPGRLSALADELTPPADPAGQAAAAKGRYRRQRRTRAGLAAVAVAVVAIGIGVPTALGSLSGAPPTGGTAGVPSSAPTAAPATDDVSLAEAQARLAAVAADRAADSSAELARAVGQVTAPLRLTAPATFGPCPDGAPALSTGLGVPVTYWQGHLPGGPAGCQWATGTSGLPADRFAVGIGFLTGTTAAQMQAGVASSGEQCTTAAVPAVHPQAELQRCTQGDAVEWYLDVPDTSGRGIWVLNATVGTSSTGPTAGTGLAQVAALATATWGS